ncbi:MAG: uridine diphosphate-N-acetylglucosamine-binding protein YvcK [Acidothermus cellulolyticus]|nr:uridine diphosphate-N-acetylglucosamine-binding protein YvcK [Acidothermus cellulolyticus]
MPPRVVALGGGHGLAASLSALRRVTDRLTAVVTVADDGGSSGRLRQEFGVLPPGDLRKALAALCADDEWGRTWADVIQHRFRGDGPLRDHALGNLLIVGITELLGNQIAALDLMGRLLQARGRVLPMSTIPLDIQAEVAGLDPADPTALRTVRGQVAVATARGRVVSVSLVPEDPPACPEAVAAIRDADWVVLGPGSWFSSVLPHLLVPDLADAINTTRARRLVALNLAPQPGETADFSPENHLEALIAHAPQFHADVVLADPSTVGDAEALQGVVGTLGARLVVAPVARDDGTPRHDPGRLATAYWRIFADLTEEPDAARRGGEQSIGGRTGSRWH